MPGVAWAEPTASSGSSRRPFAPNDTFYRFQWNLKQVNAERTWGIQKGVSTVAVAVLDTGVAFEDYTDPVTGQAFRKAPDWGDTRFLPGYDFFNGDAHPNDDRNHGTHVASTIAEGTNNALGLAGLAFGCAIMPVKVLGANGVGTFFALADGIDYAITYTENGRRPVKVINLSLSSSGFNQTVKSAIDRAVAAGVLVAAAGATAPR
jgi:serine protease